MLSKFFLIVVNLVSAFFHTYELFFSPSFIVMQYEYHRLVFRIRFLSALRGAVSPNRSDSTTKVNNTWGLGPVSPTYERHRLYTPLMHSVQFLRTEACRRFSVSTMQLSFDLRT